MSKLGASRMVSANLRQSAHSLVKSASKVEHDMSSALMAVPREGATVIKRKVAIIGLELKDASKQMST